MLFESSPLVSVVANLLGTMIYIVLLHTNIYRFCRQMKETVYLEKILIISMIAGFIDTVGICLDGHGGTVIHWFILIQETLIYVVYTILPYYWFRFFESHLKVREKKWEPLLFIPLTVNLLILLMNFFTHNVFIVTADNHFERRPLYMIYFLVMIFHALLTIVMYFSARKKKAFRFFPVIIFACPVMLGEIMQMIFGAQYSLIFPCMAISLVGIFAALQNEEIYRDQLTHIFNRNFLGYLKNNMNVQGTKKITGIMIDLNSFKQINDRFGHKTGDQALIDTAKILERIAGHNGSAIRYSGDEFILLLATDDQDTARSVRDKIRREFELFNVIGGRPYKLSAAMGIRRFDPTDAEIDEFINEIDEQMYADKKSYYSQPGMERRSLES